MSDATVAYIALGSNLGNRLAFLRRAVMLLKDRDGILADSGADVASLFETEPVGDPAGQTKYLNSALRVRTTLEPLQVMETLLEIEGSLGRKREVRWESRIMDLDLLLYDQYVCKTPALTIPHPRMHERRFVLEPLAEIAGDVLHPLLGTTIAEMNCALRETSRQGIVRIAGPEWASDPP